jgi:dihydrodipicolinate synthase/N-acetylneuraminate lyase
MDTEQARADFRGPMISVATPFTPDQRLDLERLRSNIRFMVDRGVGRGRGVLLVAAAGGEFPMLSMDERKEVTRASVEAASGDVAVATSIQFNGTREVVELARYAHQVGASLGQLSAPSYYEPPDEDILTHFGAASHESDLPIMIYNNWWNTLNMNLEMVERLSQLRNVVALKWSAPTWAEYTEGLQLFSQRLALIDNSTQHVWSHMMGAVGFITHVSNFWPEYPLAIWDLLERKAYEEIIPQLAAFKWPWRKWTSRVVKETEGEGPFIKAAMEEVGLSAGPPRAPARPVREELRTELRQLLAQAEVPIHG